MQRVIAEIVQSERTYLGHLQELLELYVRPAALPVPPSSSNSQSRETVVPLNERGAVFGTVESIVTFHATVFLPDLEKAGHIVLADRRSTTSLNGDLVRHAAQDIAQVFSAHAAFLKYVPIAKDTPVQH